MIVFPTGPRMTDTSYILQKWTSDEDKLVEHLSTASLEVQTEHLKVIEKRTS